jgi:hypothetical protein
MKKEKEKKKNNVVHNISYTTWIESTVYGKVLKWKHSNGYNQKAMSYLRIITGTINSQIKLLTHDKKLNTNQYSFLFSRKVMFMSLICITGASDWSCQADTSGEKCKSASVLSRQWKFYLPFECIFRTTNKAMSQQLYFL